MERSELTGVWCPGEADVSGEAAAAGDLLRLGAGRRGLVSQQRAQGLPLRADRHLQRAAPERLQQSRIPVQEQHQGEGKVSKEAVFGVASSD